MRKWIFTSMAVLALLLAACGGDDDDPGGDDGTGDTAAATTSGSTATASSGDCTVLDTPLTAGELSWAQILPAEVPDLGDFSVEDTEGDAPLINVLQNGAVLGTVELLQFPTTANVDVTRPTVEGLQEWAERFYGNVAPSREEEGGTLEGDEPVEANVGEACGVQYSYTVLDESDEVIERYVGYATHDGERMYLFVALYDAAIAAEQGFKTVEAVRDFEPAFGDLIAALDLPPG